MTDASEHTVRTCEYSAKQIELERRSSEVPHECSDPGCPGNVNRLKLKQLAECRNELALLERNTTAVVNTVQHERDVAEAERDKLRVACEQIQDAFQHYSFCKLRYGKWEEREPCTSEIKERIAAALEPTK